MSETFSLSCQPQPLPHIRRTIPAARKGGVTSLCRVGLPSWRQWRVLVGEAGRGCLCVFLFWKAPSAGGSSSPHFITGWASLSFEHRCSQPPEIHRGEEKQRHSAFGLHLFAECFHRWDFLCTLPETGMRGRLSPATGHCHQIAPKSSYPLVKQPWKSLTLPKTVIWAVPSPCKDRGFVFRHGSQAKTPPRMLLPATSSSEKKSV